MANNKPGYSFFLDRKGFDLSRLPQPYSTWPAKSDAPEHRSKLNVGTATAPLNAYIVRALLEYADIQNCEIGVVKVAEESYASQWTRADGKTIVAHATGNGVLTAGIRDPLTGTIEALPQLAASNEFNSASIIILYMLIQADKNAAAGETGQTITHGILQAARDEYAQNHVLSETLVRVVNDDVYHVLANGVISPSIRGGNVSKFTDRRLTNNEFASGEIVCGHPDILVPQAASAAGSTGRMTVGDAKALAEPYTSTLQWTPEEEAMIPSFEDDKEVPPEVMTILNRFLASREWKNPLNNPCWRGITAYGKSTGVKILACILHTPLVWMTCATTTEVEDFLSKHVPNTSDRAADVDCSDLPTYEDIGFDPEYAYETITGRKLEGATENDALKAYAIAVGKRLAEAKNPFKIVESDFVRALVNGYIVEVQEFSRIRDSGTLVGLNNFNEPGSVIPLVDGRHVRRHRNAMVVWTDNIGYTSCRKVDGSVLRRMSYIIDSSEMPKERALRRIKKNTGCNEDSFLGRMYDVWSKIGQYCKDHDITDEGTCSLTELESWVALTMLEGREAIVETCKQAVVSKLSSDPDTQKELMDSCVEPALSKAKLKPE